MEIRTTKFRCDLCGEYRDYGVTESAPSHDEDEGDASTRTCVCDDCVTKAVKLLINPRQG